MLLLVTATCTTLLCVSLTYGLPYFQSEHSFLETTPPPSPSQLRGFKDAVIVTDAEECSEIGSNLLRENGSAVDAAIGALLCVGVVNAQSAGIGGGLMMTVYDRTSGSAKALIGRETAPAASTKNMYLGNKTLSQTGWMAAGVPGEVAAYWEAHQRYGRLPWSRLFQPTIALCRRGYRINYHQAVKLLKEKVHIAADPVLRELFINASSGLPFSEGHVVRRPVLADTLEQLAKEGAAALYNGSIGRRLVEDIQGGGGIITMDDLRNYRPRWEDPVAIRLSDASRVYGVPPPGSGSLVALILNIMNEYYHFGNEIFKSQEEIDLLYHRLVEAFKFAYAQRTFLGDPKFTNITELIEKLSSRRFAATLRAKISDTVTYNSAKHYGGAGVSRFDSGTSQLSVIDRFGSAVAVTSTVNLLFGARVVSPSTGILLNDQMDDFSTPGVENYFQLPPTTANYIEPGKMMLSSMCPTIFVDADGDVRLVTGAAGGSRITTSTAFTAVQHLILGKTVKEAVDFPRLHHQLYPMKLHYSPGFPQVSIDALKQRGHVVEQWNKPSVVQMVARQNGTLYGCHDYRKHAGDTRGV